MSLSHLYPVILASGSGTRFWPVSRERFPKQLLRIIGDETLIQQTVRRVLKAVPPQNVWIVTNAFLDETIKLQLSDWKNELAGNFVIEPESRNTGPAIGLAALRLLHRDPDAQIRHLIAPEDEGKYILVDVLTGDYEIADRSADARVKLRRRRPDAVIHTMRRHETYVGRLRSPRRTIRNAKGAQ